VAQPITYQDLLDIQERLVQQDIVKQQTAANRAAALRSFLRHNHLEVNDPVGTEFRVSFSEKLREFAEGLAERGTTPRNVTNTLAALRPWRDILVRLDTERAMAGENLPPYSQAFKALLKDIPADRLAKLLTIPRDMVYGWLKGKKPRISSLKHIYKVERHFGISEGELATLAGFRRGVRERVVPIGQPPAVSYRDELSERTSLHYFAKPEPESPLRAQWQEFVRYKTDFHPVLLRSNRGSWRPAPFEFRPETPSSWAEYLDGVEIPSARMTWAKVAAYLGWLSLSPEHGGLGMPKEQSETLAWLAVREKVDAYVRWMVRRSGGKYNGSAFEFFAKANSMLRASVGYLWQLPSMKDTLPPEFRERDWQRMCEETYQLLNAMSVKTQSSRVQTRDPRAPMRHILDLEKPLEMVADMVQRLRADRPIGGAPMREAIWARDAALNKLLVSNPLRLRNLAVMTWRADNTGELYQRGDGSWWLRIERGHFKNTRGAAGDNEYDMPVQQMAWSDLERYLKVYRPRMLRCDSDYVFLAGSHGSTVRDPALPWTDLSRRVEHLTAKYLWRCAGIGTHAFRHLVATAIIKASDLSDFKTAALVLNDRMSTVEKNYAHLRSSEGANRMTELLGATLRRM
jgi:site-specific recombinase XerC